jgi:hypothetical protein
MVDRGALRIFDTAPAVIFNLASILLHASRARVPAPQEQIKELIRTIDFSAHLIPVVLPLVFL